MPPKGKKGRRKREESERDAAAAADFISQVEFTFSIDPNYSKSQKSKRIARCTDIFFGLKNELLY